MANVSGATAAAFIAAQQSLRAAENDAFDTNSVLDPNNQDLVNAHVAALARVQAARLVCNAAAGPAYETTRALVEDLLWHFLEFKVSVGPTVPATLVNALLETSFSSLGQQLEDAAAPTAVIIEFRAALSWHLRNSSRPRQLPRRPRPTDVWGCYGLLRSGSH
ncbi:hypothetical protein B0H16DRAFT_761806 [Mycena metata]|uniref:Uncharacterized protein n=1 Tax=Mycena metata TaxID=1033252 RepID=A0AAD7IZA7_9AGAR|nr:hypothetical protein B0H16DRAFT_761806 [Mycena metata]